MIAALLFLLEWGGVAAFAVGILGGLTQGGDWFVVALVGLIVGAAARIHAGTRVRSAGLAALARSLGL